MLTKEQRKEVERLARQMRFTRTVAIMATQTRSSDEIELWEKSGASEVKFMNYLDTITES